MAAQLWPPCAPTPTGDSAALGLDRRSRFFTVPAVGTAPFTDQWVMDRIRLRGGRPLDGSIAIGGAKNAALPLMAASLLTPQTLTLGNVPHLADIATMRSEAHTSELKPLMRISYAVFCL